MELYLFYVFAALALVSALVIIFTKNVLYAAFALVLTLLCIAAVYVYAMAPFIAVIQIIVYIGGVLVLMIFGMMLTNRLSNKSLLTEHHYIPQGLVLTTALFVLIYKALSGVNFSGLSWMKEGFAPAEDNIQQIGVYLMSDYILPFEVAAVLLLSALIGALVLSQRKERYP